VRRAIRLEFRKMRRLRTLPIVLVMVVAIAALSSASLFAGSTRATFDDPAASPWAGLLLSYTLMAAMTSPILAAVLASRQTDIEHAGAGWTLAATAGLTPGTLCRAKLAALSGVLLPAVLLQTLLVVCAGTLAGIRLPLDAGPWIGYTLLLLLVDVALVAVHVWLAAVVENQLISVGVGMLGAFLAVFTLLAPGAAFWIVPWGAYALISHVAAAAGEVGHVTPPYPWIVGFLALVGVAFTLATRRFDRLEG
jgi:lantibiotic transport system permease protein